MVPPRGFDTSPAGISPLLFVLGPSIHRPLDALGYPSNLMLKNNNTDQGPELLFGTAKGIRTPDLWNENPMS